jgi:hypothetical protein
MNAHWQTNIGGAIGTTGTVLLGVGLVPQLLGLPSKVLTAILVTGLVLSAIGKGMTALFAADAKTVNNVAAEVDRVNQEGPSVFAQPALENKPPEVPAQTKTP